jgi:hypothetical protein
VLSYSNYWDARDKEMGQTGDDEEVTHCCKDFLSPLVAGVFVNAVAHIEGIRPKQRRTSENERQTSIVAHIMDSRILHQAYTK